MNLQLEPTREARFRDVIPVEWDVDGPGDVEAVDVRQAEGVKRVFFEPEGTGLEVTYYARTPDDLAESGEYEIGPVEANPGDRI